MHWFFACMGLFVALRKGRRDAHEKKDSDAAAFGRALCHAGKRGARFRRQAGMACPARLGVGLFVGVFAQHGLCVYAAPDGIYAKAASVLEHAFEAVQHSLLRARVPDGHDDERFCDTAFANSDPRGLYRIAALDDVRRQRAFESPQSARDIEEGADRQWNHAIYVLPGRMQRGLPLCFFAQGKQ